jgi:hypothetical protein
MIVKFAMAVPGTNVGGEKEGVTPLGRPVTERARELARLPCGALQVSRRLVACPNVIESVAGAAVSVHFGTIAVTINGTVAVCVIPPPVALIVIV